MNNDITNYIKKSLEYYDNQQYENRFYLNNIPDIDNDIINNNNNIKYISWYKNNEIKLKTHYEIIGIFDSYTKIWVNSWSLLNYKSILGHDLFEYAYNNDINNINNSLNDYIKIQLLNSRFIINNNIELDIYLALISYLLKDKIKFIFPMELPYPNDKTRYKKTYLLIL